MIEGIGDRSGARAVVPKGAAAPAFSAAGEHFVCPAWCLALCLIWATLLFAVPSGAQEVGAAGPFRTMERNPIYRLFHTPSAEAGDLVGAGTVGVSIASTYSNIFEWIRTPRTSATMDMERWVNQIDLRYGMGEDWEVGGKLAVRTSWGGFLDGLVQWYHARVGLPNGDREVVEDGEFSLELLRDGQSLIARESGTRMEDPILMVGRRLAGGAGEPVALAARLTARLPLGSSQTSSGKADFGLQIDGRHSWTLWHFHGGIGVTTINPPEPLDPFVRSSAWFGHLGAERVIGSVAAQVQLQGGSAYLEGLGNRELDRVPINLAVGVSGGLRGWTWQAAFVEDIRPNSPSVDFTLDLRLSRGF